MNHEDVSPELMQEECPCEACPGHYWCGRCGWDTRAHNHDFI